MHYTNSTITIQCEILKYFPIMSKSIEILTSIFVIFSFFELHPCLYFPDFYPYSKEYFLKFPLT